MNILIERDNKVKYSKTLSQKCETITKYVLKIVKSLTDNTNKDMPAFIKDFVEVHLSESSQLSKNYLSKFERNRFTDKENGYLDEFNQIINGTRKTRFYLRTYFFFAKVLIMNILLK